MGFDAEHSDLVITDDYEDYALDGTLVTFTGETTIEELAAYLAQHEEARVYVWLDGYNGEADYIRIGVIDHILRSNGSHNYYNVQYVVPPMNTTEYSFPLNSTYFPGMLVQVYREKRENW